MSNVELTDALLARLAGWEIVKQARGLLAAQRVVNSDWQPPLLRGMVQEGSATYRAALNIRSASDAENLCPCRDSRQRGIICAHAVAVGLHYLKSKADATASLEKKTPVVAPAERKPRATTKALKRASAGEEGERLELFVILPPNLAEAVAKGKVMVCVEGKWSGGRAPLTAPSLSNIPFILEPQDAALLDALELLNDGDTPAMMQLNTRQFGQLLPMLASHPRVTLGRTQPVEIVLEAATPKFKLHLAGGLAMLQAKLDCYYGGKPVALLADDVPWPDLEFPTRYWTRNVAAEHAAVARLTRSGFAGPDAQGFYNLNGQNPVLNFFAREYPRLESEWEVTLEERLELSTQKNLERIEPRFQITPSGEQWFDLTVSYKSAGSQVFSAADIQRLLLSGQGHTRLKNGKFALLDTGAVEELQEVLLDCAPQQHSGGYRLGHEQSGFLDAALRQQPAWQVQAPAAWTQRAAQQRGEVKLVAPPLGELESVLRPYQKAGVAWLYFLRANAFGGILADEMGLGKTLQVLALLAALRNLPTPHLASDPAALHSAFCIPHLVVCPTSLVFNWAAEAAKFTPSLRVLALHGGQRGELFAQIPEHDLVITSYALLRRDARQYQGLEFDTIVLDEAQHIKNRQTQNAQAVKAIRARHRIVLTGTPMENSVLDLWSIFDFLMPGYLGTAQDFRERYEVAIARDKSPEAQGRLARRLRPFMLRRLKREVAADLPDKIQQVSYCELNEEQRAVYQQVIEASRREILNAVDANGLAKSRMMVLTALLRLRQICCDLRLLKVSSGLREDGLTMPVVGQASRLSPGRPALEPASASETLGPAGETPAPLISGKMELFGELLEEVLDGGHRVLVFSQFTSVLALLRDALAAQQIQFCYLDGATKDRAQVVQKFQSDTGIPVFLISLKAGGTGLNLTGADTVIHFDPWWNPAVEAQATDRAHRLGQKKIVTSYKLITRGTVEEKILNLQNRKRELIETMLGGEEQLAEALDWAEIQELLA